MKKILFLIFLGIALLVFSSGAQAQIVISEVVVSPSNDADDFDEYIELYNTTSSALDLDGWQFADGDALDTIVMWDTMTHGPLSDTDAVTDTTLIPAGSYALILDPEYNDTGGGATEPYDFPIGTVILTVADTTLGNGLTGTDPITLYDSIGTGLANVADTYGTPVEAEDPLERDDDELDGIPLNVSDGNSASRIDLFEIDEESNWYESLPTPGYGNTGDIANIIYVKEGASGDGTSWASAYGILQDALDDANTNPDVNQIWVATGTYYPTYDYGLGIGDRGKHFRLINGVTIYGGFTDTGGPDMDDRSPNIYETILSGDISTCYHVLYHPDGTNLDSTAVLDGFTITGGNANGSDVDMYGGGMLNHGTSPTVTNCTFRDNTATRGGGMFNWCSSATVKKCLFRSNNAIHGGGIYNNGDIGECSPNIVNCIFQRNWANYGGAMENSMFISATIINCLFRANWSYDYGGGISNYGDSCCPKIINCTFNLNTAYGEDGGGMFNEEMSEPEVANCIFFENYASSELQQIGGWPAIVTYSYVQGGYSGTGNIDLYPSFVDLDGPDNIYGTYDDNLRLLPDSPCIDTGDVNSLPPDAADLDGDLDTDEPTPLDLDGRIRVVDGDCDDIYIVDMGAYEFLRSDIDGNGSVDFVDFNSFALHWLDTACGECSGADLTCDGNVNEDDLQEFCDNWLAGTDS